jgi:thiol-disulfide isomerase/thioredoxin
LRKRLSTSTSFDDIASEANTPNVGHNLPQEDPNKALAAVTLNLPLVREPFMKSHLLLAAAIFTASVATPIESLAQERPMQTMTMRAHPLPFEGTIPSLAGATTWLNSQPLTPEALRGKVVLVDFWTYTCINWQRTQPYLRAWAEKYKDQGLVVIGAHTPEFGFEKNVDNIGSALKRFRIDYPVAVDSDYAVWNAFGNHYWPAIYVVDANGKIRYHQFGEGEYERTEAVIQQLLREAGYSGMGNDAVQVDARGSEVGADWDNLRSQENYLGRDQTQGFASAGSALVGKSRTYTAPSSLRLNQWALSGDWTVSPGAVALDKAGGRVVYRFHARDLHLVMGPSSRGSPVRFRVLLDGQPPGNAHGGDVDEQGNGTVTEQRLYQLIRQPKPIADRMIEIEFLDPGVEAYVFTFG